jgi:murein DD-endopeptidase MepM/ murein hydrolase activator NlpD
MYSKPFNGNFRITSPFGMRGGKLHSGIDWGCPQGTPLLAIMSGTVTVSQVDQHGAGWIDILSPDGILVRYLHLSSRHVGKGVQVTRGQQIGLSGGQVGTIGAGQSTGPHLHLAISKNGNPSGFYDYQDIIAQWGKSPMPTVTRFNKTVVTNLVNSKVITDRNKRLLDNQAGGAAWNILEAQSANAKEAIGYMNLHPDIRGVVETQFDISPLYLCERIIEKDKIIADLRKQLENK